MIRSHTFECSLHIDWERREIMGEGRRRLLVIEDDPETAEQLVDFLSTSGYQVDLAADGNEGLSRGRSADYAVMTIDRGARSGGSKPSTRPADPSCKAG